MLNIFAEDILGTNRGHVPRHAKVYRNLAGELDRIQQERVQAFREYQADVLKGAFPDAKNTVSVKSENTKNSSTNSLQSKQRYSGV